MFSLFRMILSPLAPLTSRLKRLVVGPNPNKIPRRLATVVLILSVSLAALGALYLSRAGLEGAGTSSLTILRPALEIATSTWTYVFIVFLVAKGILLRRDEHFSAQAASATGFASSTVKRLAYEAKSPDGSTRVIATSEDDPDEIENRVLNALETGEDDTFSLNPDAFTDSTEDEIDDGALVTVEETNEESRDERSAAPRWRGVLGGVLSRARTPAKALAFGLATSALWLLLDLVARLGGWILSLAGVDVAGAIPGADVAFSALGYVAAAGAGVAIVALEVLSRRRERERAGLEDGREESPDPWLESYKVARLDLASSLDLDEILWSVLVPAGLTVAGILLVVRLWVQPWLYVPILAAGILVGILNYGRVLWTRSRRLESVRSEVDVVSWDDVAILVKEVETPETPMHYAWLGTRRYAHENREEFASEVALRAYEKVNGVKHSPSVMEKQADQLEAMHPDLPAYRADEKERIMTWLLESVEGAREGLVPKMKLIEETVEHDLGGRAFTGAGKGYDPELVRSAYRDLVPAALVEQEIETPEGDMITAVRHRNDPLPPEFGAVRVAFSSQFAGYARWDPLYELPDVSDRLEAEPRFASRIGYRGSDR